MNRWIIIVGIAAIVATVVIVGMVHGPVAKLLSARADRKERERARREAFERSKDLVAMLLQDPFLARGVLTRLEEELGDDREEPSGRTTSSRRQA